MSLAALLPTLIALAVGAPPNAAAQDPAGLRPIFRDECGIAGRQPHLIRGASWTYEAGRAAGPPALRTVAFDAESVRIRYTGLSPHAHYALRVSYLTEVDQARSQRLTANGVVVHEALDLPRGKARTFDFALPDGIVRENTLTLEFGRVTGPNAVVGAVELWSDVAQPALTLSATVDETTRRVSVTARDGLLQPVRGRRVSLRLAAADSAEYAPAQLSGVTGPQGTYEGAIPASWFRLPQFRVHVQAWADGCEASETIDVTPFALPDYAPVPSRVAGVAYPRMSLDGYWRFCPAPGGLPEPGAGSQADWKPILAPGEWTLQGFTVAQDAEAAYRRVFTLPIDWRGKRIRLRFGAVFCDARVWVNGRLVATHRGGFTPFEADISSAVHPGPNQLVVGVRDQGVTDLLEKGSQYAFHRIGGILRSVSLVALPPAHLTRLHVRTRFPQGDRSSVLDVAGAASTATPPGSRVRFALEGPSGACASQGSAVVAADRTFRWSTAVQAPALWTAETPRLYRLIARTSEETVTMRVGFRDVRVVGGRLLVNGRPVKLRGVNRHEVHPKQGRAMAGLWRLDAELLKEANVNFVRTSHYPAAPEFLDACDEVGIYVLEEAPLIWVTQEQSADPSLRSRFVSAAAEMVERDRDHPCVILWSLANESAWGPNFDAERRHVAQADPTRPIVFGGQNSPGNGPADALPILSIHYPAPDVKHSGKAPYLFTEYGHINCYNKTELALDPGVRDEYGKYLRDFWTNFDAQESIIGGSIWAGIDEVFDAPSARVGYGEWGILDGDRRKKPEWWHVKKVYSPIRVVQTTLPAHPGARLSVPVWNRFDFLNLSALRVEWRAGRRSGVAHASVPPRTRGTIELPGPFEPGDTVQIAFTLGGRTIDEERLTVGARPHPPNPGAGSGPAVRLSRTPEDVVVRGARAEVRISQRTGLLVSARAGGRLFPIGGPWLHVLSRGECREWPNRETWTLARIDAMETPDGRAVVTASGSYGATAGAIRYEFGRDGGIRVFLDFTAGSDVPADPKEYGLRLALPAAFDRLKWRREGLWTTYPPDHIGRLVGEAEATPDPTSATWSRQGNEFGSNDFRSMKYRVSSAILESPHVARVCAQPTTGEALHSRSCREGAVTAWYLNAYANGGAEPFLAGSLAGERIRLRPGDRLRASIELMPEPD